MRSQSEEASSLSKDFRTGGPSTTPKPPTVLPITKSRGVGGKERPVLGTLGVRGDTGSGGSGGIDVDNHGFSMPG